MSLIVSDASPVHYLILIDAINVLPFLFAKVVIPTFIVEEELLRPKTPQVVQNWICNLPDWVEVRSPSRVISLGLDKGEEHAIALAIEMGSPILLDEREARQEAQKRGLIVVGAVGIIERAARLSVWTFRRPLTP